MLALNDVARELPQVVARLDDRLQEMRAATGAANGALAYWAESSAEADERIAAGMTGDARPFALSHELPPDLTVPAVPAGPYTVVAADGSSIPVDRFAPLPCYALNIGVVAFPYEVEASGSMTAAARLGPPAPGADPDVSGGGLDLLRDVCELEAAWGAAAERTGNGPVVVLIDGTLLPWDLDSPQLDTSLKDSLRNRTAAVLDAFRDLPGHVAVGAYVSSSRASDVVNSLRALVRPDGPWPSTDGLLFRTRLAEGERSAVFRARSERARRIETSFAPEHQVCFFYVRFGDDLARVELPAWAATADRVARLHAVLVDQCARCAGYPRALQEAHEQAVITAADRELFHRLLEKQATLAGMAASLVGKAASKRRRAV